MTDIDNLSIVSVSKESVRRMLINVSRTTIPKYNRYEITAGKLER
ncbi:hypothetical protein [Methanosarcina mazei]|nr:hypothetical protein [Methanosarcina mazei]